MILYKDLPLITKEQVDKIVKQYAALSHNLTLNRPGSAKEWIAVLDAFGYMNVEIARELAPYILGSSGVENAESLR